MKQVSRVHELEGFEHLVYNVLLVNLFQDVSSDNCMQIRIHKVKYQINIAVVFSPDNILQPDYIIVSI